MGLFDFFGKKEAPAPMPRQVSGIPYDAMLIRDMLDHHKQLFAVFTGIVNDHKAGNYSSVVAGLEQFKRDLQKHLLLENVKLYNYLEQNLQNDPGTIEIVRGFHTEMDGIGRVVMSFIEKYKDINNQSSLAAAFDDDLNKIAAALTDRVQREESTLYPLYMQKY